MSASDPKQPASGLIPYAINAPFWSDGADKDRWIGLPDGQNITVQSSGDWDFPNGTVLMKNFRVGTRLIETRLFMRHPDGNWGGYTYEWNAQQTDATLVRAARCAISAAASSGSSRAKRSAWSVTRGARAAALGLETAQLNRDFIYPQTGRTANELSR